MEKEEDLLLLKELKKFLDEKKFKGKDYCEKLDEFSKYSLWNLRGDTTWGKCSGSTFDSDDTYITRIIFSLVWDIPFEKIGQGKDYRGDTLNSFATLMSKDLEISLLHLCIDETYNLKNNSITHFKIGEIEIGDHDLITKIIGFVKIYLTIGNMIPLPNNSVDGQTLNKYRANAYADCFDGFLGKLEECFLDKNKEEIIYSLYRENKDILEKVAKGYEPFLSAFFLNEYKNFEKPFSQYKWRYHAKKENEEEYKQEIRYYIDKATDIIKNRSEEIVKKLKKILEERCSYEED